MKKRVGQVFSLALAVVLMIAMAIPAHADVSDAAGYVVGEFWDMMTGKEYDMYFDYWKNFVGYLAGEECPSSPDKYHHGNVPVGGIGVFGSGGTDDNGKFVWHTCDYCGEQFKVYASDLQQSYDAQVEELPATGYNSAGRLIWHSYYGFSGSGFVLSNTSALYFIDFSRLPYKRSSGALTERLELLSEEKCLKFSHFRSDSSSYYLYGAVSFKLKAPISGTYFLMNTPYCVSSGVKTDGSLGSLSKDYSKGSSGHYLVGESFSTPSVKNHSSTTNYVSGVTYIYFPYYEIVPDSSIDGTSGDTYNITSRPTSITGDYGIIGDNGQIIKVEGDKIVNETNNTYINPATGTTDTITDWSYDYSTRTYTLTLGGGTTTTVTYGDENVVIKEGDITYNIYYLVNGSGSENPDPGPDVPGSCNHQWSETSTTPATCTVPGSRTLTCSLCNETKTETIPAPGHKWTIKQEVKTEYDEEGNKTQDGYTIFECSVCGEQYKSTDGGAPPGGGGSGSGSSGGVFSGIFGLLVDFLGFFWNTFRDFVGEGVKGFLTALMDGTSSIFGLLNPFNWGG